jgi:hypothetical protein
MKAGMAHPALQHGARVRRSSQRLAPHNRMLYNNKKEHL